MRIYNYTGKTVKLTVGYRTINLPARGNAVVTEIQSSNDFKMENICSLKGEPQAVKINSFAGRVEGLPESIEGVYYVVHPAVAAALVGRKDLLVFDEPVYDGVIISGYKALKVPGYV